MTRAERHRGSCLCGAVVFEVSGPLPAPIACHCSMCRKVSGHFGVASEVPDAAIRLISEKSLRWFASSPKVRRGFCGVCGSSLLFDAVFKDWTGISMGAFDGATRTHLAQHIFVADKGDYYRITDGLPQNAQ
ncbi:GFA family protein [uncultured Sulfitobacter sp.]|uniref:GFA family protein n=1 Tax=uncultured Sulfitobacter sp. TaxID=191468 RepID=UPI00262E565A|nr:GFA family protein [uncultured Sulfitobacter sp.]